MSRKLVNGGVTVTILSHIRLLWLHIVCETTERYVDSKISAEPYTDVGLSSKWVEFHKYIVKFRSPLISTCIKKIIYVYFLNHILTLRMNLSKKLSPTFVK